MSRKRKSKVLAAMLCATTVAAFYAAPVMAGSVDSVTGDSTGIHINIGYDKDKNGTVIQNGVISGDHYDGSDGFYVTDSDGNGVENDDNAHRIVGKLTIGTDVLTSALSGHDVDFGTVTADSVISGSVTTIAGNDLDEVAKKTAGINGGDTKNSGTWTSITAKNSNGNNQITVGDQNVSTKINGTERIVTDKDGTTFKNVRGDKTTTIAGDKITTGSVTIGSTNINEEKINSFSTEYGALKDKVDELAGYSSEAERITALEKKTSTITVTPGNPAGSGSEKMDTTTISGILAADVFTANQATIGGVSMMNGAINAANGSFTVDNSGNLTAASVTTDSFTTGKFTAETVNGANIYTTGMNGVGIYQGRVDADQVVADKVTVGNTAVESGRVAVGGTVIEDGRVYTENIHGSYGNIGNVEMQNGTVNAAEVMAGGYALSKVGKNTAGITRMGNKEFGYETTIEKTMTITSNGDVTIGNGIFKVDAVDNIVTVGGVEFNGGNVSTTGVVTAGNFKAGNYDLISLGDKVADMQGDVVEVGNNVAGITREGETTTIEGTLSVSKDKVSTNIGGSMFEVSEDWAMMQKNGNVIAVTDGGVSLTSGATQVVVNGDGATFKGNDETKTVINGGNIDAVEVTAGDYKLTEVGANVDTIGENTQAISYKGGTTTINSAISARQGDASFEFNKYNVALNNGANSVMVGANGITLSSGSEALTVTQEGLGYADGAFAVGTDGTVKIAGGTNNSITLDAATGVVSANDFSNGEYSLSGIGDQLKDLEAGVGNLGDNVAGITREGEVTTIEGVTSFDSTGMMIEDGNKVSVVGAGAATFTNSYGTTSINGGNVNIDGSLNVNGVDFDTWYNEVNSNIEQAQNDIKDLKDKTQHITADENGTNIDGNVNVGGDINGGAISGDGNLDIAQDGHFGGDVTVDGNINANTGDIGGVHMEGGAISTGNTTINGSGVTTDKVNVGNTTIDKDGVTTDKVNVGETTIDKDGITIGNPNAEGEGADKTSTTISKGDVVITDKDGNETSLSGTADRVDSLEQGMSDMSSRINKVEDRIDKVGAMAAAIANLRTMGYDPAAPTEIAVGVGQYRSETGAALGFFHYPNKNFMLSLSVSTSGDEVMGGIGATWKFGHKSPAKLMEEQKEKAAKAKIAKAEAMKKAALDAKVKAQQEKYAKMAAAQAKAAK